ncbi:hypothetical protein [Chryseobacterium sp. POL2]|uniref:hypothetical protein n=1 Tax=Chryseobacterium sp. POL2 TaxID=2713414 RepID=UPI0013E12D1B|nr:hypothetical protein [Chryseobacterium sp. POL2]QIG89469.1 hypothetical protein G6R40_07215 [Chryseobacterium sp. POL2]
MKKILFGFAVLALALQSCKKDNDAEEVYTEPTIELQNEHDDIAISKFLDTNYFDTQGNIKAFSDKDDSDDDKPKLSSYEKETLANGTIIIKRPGAQPTEGKTIAPTDSLRIMSTTTAYWATDEESEVKFRYGYVFSNDIYGSGNPQVDPPYYYVTEKFMADNKNTNRNYYQMEGFQEALQHFKSWEIEDSVTPNLQGVIIVPSRAAFARDDYYHAPSYPTYSLRNRTFVFNFQVYKSITRPKP